MPQGSISTVIASQGPRAADRALEAVDRDLHRSPVRSPDLRRRRGCRSDPRGHRCRLGEHLRRRIADLASRPSTQSATHSAGASEPVTSDAAGPAPIRPTVWTARKDRPTQFPNSCLDACRSWQLPALARGSRPATPLTTDVQQRRRYSRRFLATWGSTQRTGSLGLVVRTHSRMTPVRAALSLCRRAMSAGLHPSRSSALRSRRRSA